jgi:tricorn protease
MKKSELVAALGLVLGLVCGHAKGIDPNDTRMLEQPAISQEHIAFIYANDLWVANLDGTQARRLTVDEGVESRPFFSPDGKHLAFTAEYDGNQDVFLLPVDGGIPKRLTWHPGGDYCAGFTPDGEQVLFLSQRALHSRRYLQLFTIPLEGGHVKQLEIPNAFHACYSPDGTKLVYSPVSDAFRQWKNYRGGRISRLWVFDFADYSHREIPKPEGGCNDVHPMWIGDQIYFLSDREGEFNLYVYDVNSEAVEQLTDYEDFPIISARHHGEKIIFERSGYLHTFDPASGQANKLTVGIAADLQELRPRFVKGNSYLRSAHISPSGARAVFNYRGEIITLPAEKGDPRNITKSAGIHEKHPAWSPDGKYIAYFSDASGDYDLQIRAQDGKGPARVIPVNGTGFYGFIHWSPDSKLLTFTDNGRNYYLVDVGSGRVDKIDADELYVPGDLREIHGDWSSDSKWLAYTKMTSTFFQRVYLYNLEEKKSYAVTDGLSDATEPVFDRGGEYLYFLASTDAGPVVNWFQQSTHDMHMTRNIYLAVLDKDTPSPFVKESDEEEAGKEKPDGEEEEEKDADKQKKKKKDEEDAAEAGEEEEGMVIHTDGLQNRILAVPVDAGELRNLACASEGEVLYLRRIKDSWTMQKFKLEDREEEELAPMNGFILSADGKKMLWSASGRQWSISAAGVKPKPEDKLNTASMQVKIDPTSEWPQIFEEAWRINRDYFYDPGMHGADWQAEKEKYAQFLPHLSCRADLNRVIQWMCSEIGVGHHRGGGGDNLTNTDYVGGGLLGADISVDGNRYRIDKIFEGLNWNPELRSPLTEPGLNVEEGDYIIKVNGREVKGSDNFYSFFENTSGKLVELTLSSNAGGGETRDIRVVPIGNESALRNRDWVEANLRKVHEATDGQVAYVYVPNTTTAGHEYFKRYFFPQADKKAIIVDERFNAGGLIADYYIDILRRPYQSHWNMRYGKDLKSPAASIQGPKVMIIDETAGSGGDMLPYMFRKFGVGTLVGTRTWGGLVGTLGYPQLMDGGYVTAPNVAIWTMEEGFCVENVGVPPDIEVIQTPAEVIRGGDPQLEKAIEVVLDQLRENPPVEYVRPPYPIRGVR